jgi:pyruvate/2-oxoglutarate dehydrogenase complex dihydrolipoamide dehydrogenase (E3) component
MSEAQARAAGIDVLIGSADVGNTARGYIHGEPGGLVKLVADSKRQVLVGATLVSPRAGEMISELALAIRAQVSLELLKDLVHPFPTFSRILQGVIADLG